MHRAGFEPTISTGELPQTYALDCVATGTGSKMCCGLSFHYEANVVKYRSVEILKVVSNTCVIFRMAFQFLAVIFTVSNHAL